MAAQLQSRDSIVIFNITVVVDSVGDGVVEVVDSEI